MRTDKSLKGDLHTGFIVRTRSGKYYTVVRTGEFKKFLVNDTECIPLTQYHSNLMAIPERGLDADYDVLEIWGLIEAGSDPKKAITHPLDTTDHRFLWKRGGVENNIKH